MPPLDAIHISHYPDFGAQTTQVTAVLNRCLWSGRAQDRIRELSAMDDNWNGYGSPKIADPAKTGALKLLDLFAKLRMPEPKIVPVSGGGLQFEWKNETAELEIEVAPKGSIEYLIVDSEEKYREGQVSEHDSVSRLTPLTRWYLCGKTSVDELVTYAQPY